MSRYRTADGTIVDTQKAQASWEEHKWHNGSNWISKATGGQWLHEQLFRSAKGHYYLECWSDWQGSQSSAEMVSNEDAASWLILNEHELPEDLKELEGTVCE